MSVAEDMAASMEMFRSEMIKAGVIDASVSPMFMTEAILGAIQRAVLKECAIDAVIHSQYPIDCEFDRGYDKARKDCAEKIRSRGAA